MMKGEMFYLLERIKDKKLSFEALIHAPQYLKYLKGTHCRNLAKWRACYL
jgi:hypothetical protein